MNSAQLSLAYLRQRLLISLLNIAMLALGIATVVFLAVVARQLDGKLARDSAGIDLVVGPKGSPLQLVLSAVYHLDVPQGNIGIEDMAKITRAQFVRHAVPIALGDSVRGFRIVGTTGQYFDLYKAKVVQGRRFEKPLEAVIGSKVSEKTKLRTGDHFSGTHGLAAGGSTHETTYTVAGVLAPTGTVADRLVLTSLESVWTLHGMAKRPRPEITAILVQYSSPLGAVMIPQLLNSDPRLQAAAPAREIVRILSLVGVGLDVMRGFGIMLLISAALSVFVALYNSLQQREYDLAVLRSLGATRTRLAVQLVTEALLISGAGALGGIALGHVFVSAALMFMDQRDELGITGLAFYPFEFWILLLALIGAVIVAMIPMIKAYRLDVPTILSRK